MNEKLVEMFYKRFADYNTSVLTMIAKTMGQFANLKPNEAHKLARILKNGTSINELIRQLVQLSNLSKKEVIKILNETAKQNIEFAEPFYKYRGIENSFATSEQFNTIKKSVAVITNDVFENITKTTAIGLKNARGVIVPMNIKQAYNEVIDRCVIAISSGTENYQTMMRKTIKELSQSGVRKVYYNNKGKAEYSRRLDTSVRMNIMDGIRAIANETQKQIGEEIGADGVEITAHEFCAEDHENYQGRQYTIKKYNQINDNLERRISTLNCYHRIFSVILGVQEPQYSEEQLQAMKNRNNKGFEFEGKHYTMYQGTQLQRQIESNIRNLKDEQIMYRQINTDEARQQVDKCQNKIRLLTQKYNELSKVSGLPTKKQRLSVNGYHRIKV